MAAIASATKELTGRARAWLPEYFCEQALSLLRQTATSLLFYPVDREGRPDWEHLNHSGDGADIFFLVHFFGHCNDVNAARRFCDQRGLLMVEDAALALAPAAGHRPGSGT